MENRRDLEDDRSSSLETKLKEAQRLLTETESKYEEVVGQETKQTNVFNFTDINQFVQTLNFYLLGFCMVHEN